MNSKCFELVLLLTPFLFLVGGCGQSRISVESNEAILGGRFIQGRSLSDASRISTRILEYKNFLTGLSEKNGELNKAATDLDVKLGTDGFNKSRIIVKFLDVETELAVQKAFGGEGTQFHQFTASGAKVVPISGTGTRDVLAHVGALKELTGVEYAYPDYQVKALVTPSDTLFPKQYGLNNTGQVIGFSQGAVDADIDAPEAWQVSTGSRDVTVAIIDSGVDYTHPDLAANIWTNPGETGSDSNGNDKSSNGIDDDGNGYIDDFRGWDFVDNDNDPMDTNGHGTHVAGIIGATGNNNRGIAGVNWQVSLVPLRVLDTDGTGYNSDSIRALEYASRMGFHITNNSYAGGGFDQAFQDALTNAKNHDVLFVAASGNEANNNDAHSVYPASYSVENVLVVGASNNRDGFAYFSNYGLQSVHLVAPGHRILSTYLNHSYAYESGTSMATPFVAGAAGLVKAVNPAFTFSQIKNQIISTVDQSSAFQTKVLSGGRLNLARAVGGVASAPPLPPPSFNSITPSAGPLEGGTIITVLGSGFQNGVSVKIGNQTCTVLEAGSEGVLCAVPPSTLAGAFSISVINPDGQKAVRLSAFTYLRAPAIKSVTPTRTSVATAAAGKFIQINGSGFISGATAKVGTTNCSFSIFYSEKAIFCRLPTSLAAGTYSVVVTNPEGQNSNEVNFEVAEVASRWVSSQGGSCALVCKGEGLLSKPSPEGAYCTSGRLIPTSALETISYTNGCYPGISCSVAQGFVAGAVSRGKYCYGAHSSGHFNQTDITMGCYCGL